MGKNGFNDKLKIELQRQVAASFKKHPLYPEFLQVRQKLAQKNFVCWVAGGAVRDFLLEKKVADFDLVTDATTEQVLQIFPEALTVGASFGVVKLALQNKTDFFDLATFRRESDYVDGRRPSQVDFATPIEDAGRRDFTMNALFWNDADQEIVDFVGGLAAIESKVIVCVGDPEVRFQEDHLRILRLLRFAVQLGFTYEEKTLNAALTRVQLLSKISGERIWAEIEKMIPFIKWSDILKEPLAKKILDFLFEAPSNEKLLQGEKLPVANPIFNFFFALQNLYPDTAKTKEILKKRLKVSNDDLKIYDAIDAATKKLDQLSPAEWAYEIEKNDLLLQAVVFLNQVDKFDQDRLLKIQTLVRQAPPKRVSGDDLQGLVPPQEMGQVLKKIRLLQFEQPDLDKDKILKHLKLV